MSQAWIVALAVGVVLIILSQWFFLARYERRHKLSIQRQKLLEDERKYMESILDKSRDEATNALLRHRASLIGRLLAAEISGDSGVNDSVMAEIGRITRSTIRRIRILIMMTASSPTTSSTTMSWVTSAMITLLAI